MEFLWGRYSALFYAACAAVGLGLAATAWPLLWVPATLMAVLTVVGLHDYRQKAHPVIANYPLLGHFRYFFESIRPEVRQYFWEADNDELPYSRNQRAMVYQRAKQQTAVRPFGSVVDMYDEDHEWLNHSIQPLHIEHPDFRVSVGEGSVPTGCRC